MNDYNALIIVTPDDYKRVSVCHKRQIELLPARKIIFIGSEEVGRLLEEEKLGEKADFINENDVVSFQEVYDVITDIMAPILAGRPLPRGIAGWYYQQFIKMSYAKICDDDYYLIWDGDTVPCGEFSMFSDEGTPYLDVKHEYHEEYFNTLAKILPGMKKVIEPSFISEHMLMKKDIMNEVIEAIDSNEKLVGNTYWEKILRCIPIDKIQSNSFSEYETYGTFVALRHTFDYRIRDWRSFRMGGEFFDPYTITERDYNWLKKDFFAISFEKGQFVRDDHKNLFDNPKYQEKLSALQMLLIAQEEYKEGYKEQ